MCPGARTRWGLSKQAIGGDMEQQGPPMTEKAAALKPPMARPNNNPKSSGWRWLWLPLIILMATGAWYLWAKGSVTPAAAGGSAKGGKKGGGVVPVVATKARKGSIAYYLPGLGTVTPIYTVTVKSRVDGQL